MKTLEQLENDSAVASADYDIKVQNKTSELAKFDADTEKRAKERVKKSAEYDRDIENALIAKDTAQSLVDNFA